MNGNLISNRLRLTSWGLPSIFVVMWSSGYVAGKIGLPYAGPFTLIFLRFSFAALIMLVIALVTGAPWPKKRVDYLHLIIVGLLIQSMQFSGLYFGLSHGISAGLAALIVGLMPIITTVGAYIIFKEKVLHRQVAGLLIGLLGVLIVVVNRLSINTGNWIGMTAVCLALFGISLGTLYQKAFCRTLDLRTAGFIQLFSASLVAAVLSWHFEGMKFILSNQLIGATAWLSIVNSIGAVSVLFILMRRGQASKVSSLFYLVPSVTAIMGFVILREHLNLLQTTGFLISALGVYLTTNLRSQPRN